MKKTNTKKIIFVSNTDWCFVSHRLSLAVEAIKKGWEVYLLSVDSGRKEEITATGVEFIDVPFDRSGKNPFHELKCVYILYKLYKQIQPDIIHHIALKASILGSLAAKLLRNYNVVNAISGLGYNFTDGRNGMMQKILKIAIRCTLKHRLFSIIVQNPDDMKMIQDLELVPEHQLYLIKGQGADLNEFHYELPPEDRPITFLFPARILLDKGVMEFIEAAKSLRKQLQGKALFVLAGFCDEGNLAVLNEEELTKLLEKNYIEWIGYQRDMFQTYAQSHVVVLPSYREGLPKSLIEACAVGRPIVTTDVPGCRECVEEGYNGFLVPVKDSQALAKRMLELANNESLRLEMGFNSRAYAEKEFSLEMVKEKTFHIYDTILKQS
jgi:glycosyltransferase involved in cell wall biosynthesis